MEQLKYCIALVTTPNIKTARKLVAAALKSRVVACANIVPKIESHYWWQGKLQKSAEVLVVFKTTKNNLRRLEENIITNHPYDTPEFIVLPISAGNKRYLDWLSASVQTLPQKA